ncbi:MAG: hypothetical protein QG671_4426 [Actinomycetota bacterium]|nr:hypothetical protein [Actinomycetota bacterium]
MPVDRRYACERARRGGPPGNWLATTLRDLLDEKYGAGHVPGVRRIAADIAKANDGEAISHGHVHNLLRGEASNLTDRIRNMLARFFDKHPSYFYAPREAKPADSSAVQALAARFASFDEAQMSAIRQAIDIVTARFTREDE